MAQNIYNIPDWVSQFYYKNFIIRVANGNSYLYYYATKDHSGGSSSEENIQDGLWDGYITYNTETKPKFLWVPSYNWSNMVTPRVKSIKFGDGYEQISQDGINNILINLNISFENIDINEYTAILHFLETRKGAESFIFTPPPPRSITKRFICREWEETQNFYNNYSIKCKFEEVPF